MSKQDLQHQQRDLDDEIVAGLIHEDMLGNLVYKTFWDPPAEIASDDRLCKLHHYASFLRIYLGCDFERMVDQLEEICGNTSLEGLEHECERIARLVLHSDEPHRGK